MVNLLMLLVANVVGSVGIYLRVEVRLNRNEEGEKTDAPIGIGQRPATVRPPVRCREWGPVGPCIGALLSHVRATCVPLWWGNHCL